jgi:predicted small lipoprotein YifL
MRKSLILLVICASLTACADRERLNCPPTKNKALTAVTETTSSETTTAPRYATGAKCR